MATFAQWLDADPQLHRTDDVGVIAKFWHDSRSEYEGGDGTRPAFSAPKSILRWMLDSADRMSMDKEAISAAMDRASTAYRKHEARIIAGEPAPPPVTAPAQVPLLPVQPPSYPQHEVLEMLGIISTQYAEIITKLDTLAIFLQQQAEDDEAVAEAIEDMSEPRRHLDQLSDAELDEAAELGRAAGLDGELLAEAVRQVRARRASYQRQDELSQQVARDTPSQQPVQQQFVSEVPYSLYGGHEVRRQRDDNEPGATP